MAINRAIFARRGTRNNGNDAPALREIKSEIGSRGADFTNRIEGGDTSIMLRRVISGMQVGVDIAAIRAAKDVGLETGGFMPRTFLTKEGPRPEYQKEYNAIETMDGSYPPRTRRNVKMADATLRIAENFRTPGELCTMSAIRKYHKEYMDVSAEHLDHEAQGLVIRWLINHQIEILNVAGNSLASLEEPVYGFLKEVFRQATKQPDQAQSLGRIFKPPRIK